MIPDNPLFRYLPDYPIYPINLIKTLFSLKIKKNNKNSIINPKVK